MHKADLSSRTEYLRDSYAHWMCYIDSSETSYKISCMFYFSSP